MTLIKILVFRLFRRLHYLEDFPGGERVDPVFAVLRLAVELSTHGLSLAGVRLAVGEAGGHSAVKNTVDEKNITTSKW